MIFLRYHAFGGQSFRRSRKMRTFWTQRSWLRKWRKTWRKSFQISMTSRWRRWRLDQKMPKNRKYGVWRGDHQGILSCLFLGRGGDHKGRWWALECFQVLMSEVLFVGLLSLFVARVWVWFLHDSRWVFRFMVRFHGDVSFMGFMACPPQNQCPIFILTFSVMQPATFWMYRRLSICSDCIVVGDTQLFQPAVRHFQRSCQTSSTPWRHLPRRPETAMRPHWWCRRRRWTRCGKFGEAFWESIQLRHHHSWFIIHYPSSSWTALHPIHFLPPTPLFFFFGFGLPFQGGGTAAAVPGCHHAVGHSQDQTETQEEGASDAWRKTRIKGIRQRVRGKVATYRPTLRTVLENLSPRLIFSLVPSRTKYAENLHLFFKWNIDLPLKLTESNYHFFWFVTHIMSHVENPGAVMFDLLEVVYIIEHDERT